MRIDDASREACVRYGIMPRTPTDAPPGAPCVSMVSPRSECRLRPSTGSRSPRPRTTRPARSRVALLEGFDQHYALFRDCARAAKRHFEAGNFLAIGHVARDRIDFYDRRVDETVERIEREFGSRGPSTAAAPTRCGSASSCTSSALLIEHRQPECAETFFNSVSCKILHRTYFHNRFMFVRPAVSTEYLDADPPTYRSYYPRAQRAAPAR